MIHRSLVFAFLLGAGLAACGGAVTDEPSGTTSGGGSTTSGGGGGGGSGGAPVGGNTSAGGDTSTGGAPMGGSGGTPTGMDCNTDADCLPPPNECIFFECKSHLCALVPRAAGYPVSLQDPGDCRTNICDGKGVITNVPDDADVPAGGGGVCGTFACKGGEVLATVEPITTPCTGTCHCDGQGFCAGPGCITDAICPASPSACLESKCVGCEECALLPMPAGTPAPDPKGNCERLECDGAGNLVPINDDTDLPDDGDPCTVDGCMGGAPQHDPLCMPGQICDQGMCN